MSFRGVGSPDPVMHSDRAFTQSYPAVADTVPRARTALAMFARATGATPEEVEAIRLAVSEALTNSVLHAYGGESGAVHVSAARAGGELTVVIADDGHGMGHASPSPSPGLGMGLALIASVTDYFAMSRRTEGGTEIRMRFGSRARRPAGVLRVAA
jgi:anti-sigma regulatory factor (Ser/Thr protein kinase)